MAVTHACRGCIPAIDLPALGPTQVLGALAPPLAHGASELFEQDPRNKLDMLVPRRSAERASHAANGPAGMDIAVGAKQRAEAYLQQRKVLFGGGRTSRDALSAHPR